MNIHRILGAAAQALVLASAPLVATAEDMCQPGEVKITVSLVTSLKGHPKGQIALAIAEDVNRMMDGRLCMEVFGDSELYNDDDVLEAILRNDVQMAAPSFSKFGAYTQRLQLFDLPFLFRGPTEVIDFFSTPEAQALQDDVADDGFVALGFWSNGMRQISATRPLITPSDAAGLTFRIQPSDILEQQFALIDATPVKLPFAAVYDALASGEVGGQQNTWSNIYTKRFFEHQDGVTESNHSYLGYMPVMGKAFLDSLDEADRAELLDIIFFKTHEFNRFAFELNQLSRRNALREGVVIRRLTDEERALWEEAFSALHAQFEPVLGTELMDAARAAGALD